MVALLGVKWRTISYQRETSGGSASEARDFLFAVAIFAKSQIFSTEQNIQTKCYPLEVNLAIKLSKIE